MKIIYFKLFGAFIFSLLLTSCDYGSIEEFAFKKAIVSKLSDKCSSKNCVNAVETQSEACADKADWRRFYDNQNNIDEKRRFQKIFFSCLVDPKGAPYFII